jgi:type 1 fimbriae regulatory protein FimB
MEHLSKDEIHELVRVAKAHRERDWLMILVGYWHGLRASEVCGITASDIADGCLTVVRLKGSLKTCQPLVPHEDPLLDEAKGLIEFTREMHANQKLFPISRVQFFRLFQGYAAQAGIAGRHAHPHILKHSIAMQGIGNAGVENIRQYLGHKSLSSTGAYLKVDDASASAAVTGAVGGGGGTPGV